MESSVSNSIQPDLTDTGCPSYSNSKPQTSADGALLEEEEHKEDKLTNETD